MRKQKWIVVLVLFFSIDMVSAQQNSWMDTIPELKGITEDSARVDMLIELSKACFRSTPQKAIDYAEAAKGIAESIDYTKGVALALKYVGMGYYIQADWMDVILAWKQSAAEFEKIDDKVGISNMLNNLGAINNNEGDDTKALELFLESLKISEEIGDTLRISSALINIGLVYLKNTATHDKAEEILSRALKLCQAIDYPNGIGTAAVNLGGIFYQRDEFEKALEYYQLTLKTFRESSSGNVPFALNNVGKAYAKLGNFDLALEHQYEALELAREMNAKMEIVQSLNGLAFTYIEKGQTREAIKYYQEAQPLAKELNLRNELRTTYVGLAESFAQISDFKRAYENQYLLTDLKDTLHQISNEKKIGLIQMNYDIDKKQGEIDLLTKDKAIQDLELQRQKTVKNAFLAGLILIIIIAFIILKNYWEKVKINKVLDRQKAEIETLLLNILPKKVARELQEKGVAIPRDYESASVLFTDFKDFTKISSKLTPGELVKELNDYFVQFDTIVEKYNLEKIKTIGDAYMCAGGIPVKNDTHALDTIRAALEMQEFMKQKNERRAAEGKVPWGLRVGIHTGPVMAGVVGMKKYAYDIWGSTVNVASRMESNGEVGKVNISAATYERVKDHFNCLYRGKISAKNVGDIDMHFIESENNGSMKNTDS